MRPGAYSEGGFLGATESFELVLAQDEQTLIKLGVTVENIADELEKAIKGAMEQERKLESPESKKSLAETTVRLCTLICSKREWRAIQ